jgi:methyl halide transferase
MLALHGFDAYGLEVSQTAVSTAESYSKHQQDNVSPENFSNLDSRPSIEPGKIQFVLGDFFGNELERQCPKEASEGFDLIYDYTVTSSRRKFFTTLIFIILKFLCALPPFLRKDWS